MFEVLTTLHGVTSHSSQAGGQTPPSWQTHWMPPDGHGETAGKTQDFPSEKKHVMFQFSSECSRQDPFPFLLQIFPNGNIENEILCFGVAGREGQIITRLHWAQRFSGMSCQESEQSPASMEPSVSYWLKKLTSRALSMWSGLPADKEGPHRLLGEGWEGGSGGGLRACIHSTAPLCLKLPLTRSSSHIHYCLFVSAAARCCELDE